MNRFICLELETDRQNAINFGLFKRTVENADSINIDGVNMPQYENLIDRRNIESNYYQYGSADLLELFEFRSFDSTVRTVSGLATARGITINTNFGTFTKEFMFYYPRLLDLHTNIWYTVFDSNGELHFLNPERQSTSNEITNFDVMIKTNIADQSVNYEGETGTDFTIAVDTRCVVPTTIDSTLKQMTVNKYNSKLKQLTIQTRVDVNVLDYVIEDGDAYVILSKMLISGDNETPLYKCIAVKEVNDSLSFSGADVVNPVHYAIIPIDTMHYVGTAGEPSFQGGWLNLGTAHSLYFFKDALGWGHIYGCVKSGAWGTVFTLPTGYRPPSSAGTLLFPQIGSGGHAYVQVSSSGNVTLNVAGLADPASNVNVYMDNIHFYVGV